jgi:hypothetical protein
MAIFLVSCGVDFATAPQSPTSAMLTLNCLWPSCKHGRRNLTDFVTNCVPAGCLHKSAAQGGALPQHPGVWQALPPEGRPIFPIARALRYKAPSAFCLKTLMHRALSTERSLSGFAGCIRPTERCTAKTTDASVGAVSPVGQALKAYEVCQLTLNLTLAGDGSGNIFRLRRFFILPTYA